MGGAGSKSTASAAEQHPEFERFKVLRTLGAGGYGTVYEACEIGTGARVALKQLHDQTGESLLGFKREFRALAELSHPNVVRFLSLFEERGRFYFTMEFVAGQSLIDYVRPPVAPFDDASLTLPEVRGRAARDSGIRATSMLTATSPSGGGLDLARLRRALPQLASGLIVLHSAGLVHRDLKPQNVLVTSYGRVVLLDFGLATRLDDTGSPDLAGTFAYMAPEQALGKQVRAAADWYAFGAVLYEALTGRTPHAHLPMRNLWAEARAQPPDPRLLADGLPSDLCDLCMRLLAYAPASRPDEASIAAELGLVISAAQARASFRSRIHFARDTFVAREEERASLFAAMARAQQGACAVVRIQGESGIGKSMLVERFRRELADDANLLVLASRCYEREAVPFRGIDGLVDALAQQLASHDGRRAEAVAPPLHADFLTAVFPVMRAVPGFEAFARPPLFELDPLEARRRAFYALKELLQRLSERRTLLLQLDDAQWIDTESVTLLRYLTGGSMSRTLVVLASRPTLCDPLTQLLDEAKDVTRLVLRPLSVEESKQLIEILLAGRAASSLDPKQIAETSGGHPLFIHELVMHGPSELEDAAATLEGAIGSRVVALDEGSRSLLNVIALAASPLQHHAVIAASGLASESYSWVLSTLRNENLVSFHALTDDARVEVYHDRIREVVVRKLSAESRRYTHERIADALLRECPDEHEALAVHFAGAGRAPQAIRYATSAAERSLQKLGFENAAMLYGIALRFEEEPAKRAALEAKLAKALANSGRGKEAAEAYLRAAPHVDESSAIELRRRAGEQLLRAGHVEQGTEILFYLLRKLGLAVPRFDFIVLLSLVWVLVRLKLRGLALVPSVDGISARDRLRLDVCWTVATGLSVVHHLRATEFQARALLLALDAGDADRVIKSSALLGVALGMAGGATGNLAKALRERARQLAAERPSQENTAWLQLTDGVASMGDWAFGSCEELCARAEVGLAKNCTGAAWEIVTAQAFGLWSSAFRGNFRAAAARLPDLMASARSRGDRHAETSLILSPLHLLGLGADDPQTVRAECSRIMSAWPSRLACFQHMCGAYILAQVDLYEGRFEQAWSNVSYAWRMLRRGHLSQVQFQRVDLLGLRGRAALGQASASAGRRRRSWLRRARRDGKLLTAEAIPSALGLSALLEGGVRWVEGERGASEGYFNRAAAEFDRVGMQLHACVARVAAALAAGNADDLQVARQQLLDIGVSNPAAMLSLWLPGFGVTSLASRNHSDSDRGARAWKAATTASRH